MTATSASLLELRPAGQIDGVQQPVHIGHRGPQPGQRGDGGGERDRGQWRRDDAYGGRESRPQQEHGDRSGAQAEGGQGLLVGDDLGGETGESGQLGEPAARLFGVGHGVHLAEHDDQADAGEHALHHGDGDGAEPAAEARQAQHHLEQPGGQHDRTERAEPEFLDRLEDEHGESGGGAADLELAARQKADDEPADDAGDQAQFVRHSGGDGDADAQWQRDQEDDE